MAHRLTPRARVLLRRVRRLRTTLEAEGWRTVKMTLRSVLMDRCGQRCRFMPSTLINDKV